MEKHIVPAVVTRVSSGGVLMTGATEQDRAGLLAACPRFMNKLKYNLLSPNRK